MEDNKFMQPTRPLSAWDKLFRETTLAPGQAAIIKQSYLLLGLSVFAAAAGGFIGATSETVVSFFTSWIGFIVALVMLNVVPMVAIAARRNPVLGVSALVADGFLAGLVISPLLYIARTINPSLIVAALGITALVFLGVTGYVLTTTRTFSAPRGLMLGIGLSILGAVVLNGFLQIGLLGMLIAVAIGVFGVMVLVYATSDLLHQPQIDSPIPAALTLFAGLFNIFVAVLNLLLSFGRSRD